MENSTCSQLNRLVKKGFLIFMGLAFVSFNVIAQNFTVSGKVVSEDQQEGLVGANIVVRGTSHGTVTDINGNYKIDVPNQDAVLIVSSVGYVTEEIKVAGRSIINVNLVYDITSLSEVVVIGYGTQKKSHVTGSVSKVTNEKLDQLPISRVDDALVGQVAGVNIQMTNPVAGGSPTILVRGQGSITSSSPPLVVVDGIVVDENYLGSLDMNDVESIEVLKDAASSSIYGSRGANGVIMVTTKKGKEGATRFSYNGYVGTKSVPKNDVLTTPEKWAQFVEENKGSLTDQMNYIQKIDTYTDWEKVMMDGGMTQSHSISASGGNKSTKFRTSVSYLNDEGVLLTDSYEKINFRLNLDTKVNDRIEFGTILNPSYTSQRDFPIGLHDAIRQSPWLPLYLDENNIQYVNRIRENGRWANVQIGDYAMERMFDNYDIATGQYLKSGGTVISTTNNQNALAKVLEQEQWNYVAQIFANSYLKFNFNKDLYFRTSIGGDFEYIRATNWIGTQATHNGAADSRSQERNLTSTHLVTENTLNFIKTFGNHDISAVGGFIFEKWNGVNSDIRAAGYNFDYIRTIPDANVSFARMEEDEESLVSLLSRINYAYSNRYLFSISLRTDGSSKFGPDRKYGFFPAFSAGWRVSEESFLSNSEFISDLKVRFSYGKSGSNNGIGRYAHIGLIETVGAVLGGEVVSGFNVSNLANSELRWEKLLEWNPGIDLGLYNDRLYLSFDWYKRTSQDLLLFQPIPSVTGFEQALVNLGEVKNEGFELEMTSRNYSRDAFKWSTTALLTYNKNTLVDFADADGLISIIDDKRPAQWIAKEGYPISSFYGYKYKGEIDPQYIKDPYYPINSNPQDVYVHDISGDGKIDADDRTFLGSPYPDYIWSITNNINVKQFDISFMFQGSHGAKVRNMDPQYINNEFASTKDYNSEFPDADLVQERIYTDKIIMDASYIALRNINLGYNLPQKLNDIVGLHKARLYVSAQNLLYFMPKNYTGYNPEGVNQGADNPLTFGYQRGAAPIFRTISLGLNLEF